MIRRLAAVLFLSVPLPTSAGGQLQDGCLESRRAGAKLAAAEDDWTSWSSVGVLGAMVGFLGAMAVWEASGEVETATGVGVATFSATALYLRLRLGTRPEPPVVPAGEDFPHCFVTGHRQQILRMNVTGVVVGAGATLLTFALLLALAPGEARPDV